MVKKSLVVILGFFFPFLVIAQQVALENEVYEKNGIVYKGNRPFTGTLYSDDEGIPNDCECTLEAHYKNGKLNGWKREWYDNGNIKYEGKYVNGKPVGTHTYYYSNGKKKKKEVYRNGELVSSVLYKRDGTPRQSSPVNNVADNKAKSQKQNFDPEEKTPLPEINKDAQNNKERIATETKTKTQNNITTGHAKAEKEISIQESASSDIQTVRQPYGNAPNTGGYFLEVEYYSNKQPKRVILYYNNIVVKDTLFSEAGLLREVRKYNEGELIHEEVYFDNGKIFTEKNFLNNKQHGIQKEYFPDGQIKRIEVYDNGFLRHKELYHYNGNLLSEENYKFGKKHGEQKLFDDKGHLLETSKYDTGTLISKVRWTDKGKEVIEINGRREKIERFDKSDRRIFSGYRLIDSGKPDSLQVYWDPATGTKKKEILYREGKPVYIGTFKDGQKHGNWTVYWPNGQGQTNIVYDKGKEVMTEPIVYARQIKNNYRPGDIIFVRQQFYPQAHEEYYLLRMPETLASDEAVHIKNQVIHAFLQEGMKRVENPKKIEDQELFAWINVDSLSAKWRAKKRKHLLLSHHVLQIKDSTGHQQQFDWMIFPDNATSIARAYERDRQEAYTLTMQAVQNKWRNMLHRLFPLEVAGRLVERPQSSGVYVIINAGKNADLTPKMRFITEVNTPKGKEEIVISLNKVEQNISKATIEKGKKELTETTQHAKIIRFKRQ